MLKSPFEEERLKFQPKIPPLLRSLRTLEIVDENARLRFKQGVAHTHTPLRVGVVLSGGQAPGGHNVITGLFDALLDMNPSSRLFGFLGGPAGIIENRIQKLTPKSLDSYRNTGGFDLIGSGRTKIETPEQLEAARKNVEALQLHGLVIIGGDDSNTNAALLAEFFLEHDCKTKVIGVPKTIDGDLKNTEIETSFGFDTACKTYSELIGNVARDALSAKKYTHFIKLMGRSASHITLECALQTHPNVALIGEERRSLQQIISYLVDTLNLRAKQGKNYGVILIPEGLIEFIPEMKTLIQELNVSKEGLSNESKATFDLLPPDIQNQLLLDRDPHGNVQVSHIATEQLLIHLVKKASKEKHSFVNHFFGYEGRSCFPSNFDANYCYCLGFTAAALIDRGYTGYMSIIRHLAEPVEKWEPGALPLTKLMHTEERKGKLKRVIKKALVDLNGEPFKLFAEQREKWRTEDHYRYPGPIQLFGPTSLTDDTTFTLKLEQRQQVCV